MAKQIPPLPISFNTAVWKLITGVSILESNDMFMVIRIYKDWCETLNEVTRTKLLCDYASGWGRRS